MQRVELRWIARRVAPRGHEPATLSGPKCREAAETMRAARRLASSIWAEIGDSMYSELSEKTSEDPARRCVTWTHKNTSALPARAFHFSRVSSARAACEGATGMRQVLCELEWRDSVLYPCCTAWLRTIRCTQQARSAVVDSRAHVISTCDRTATCSAKRRIQQHHFAALKFPLEHTVDARMQILSERRRGRCSG